jgi:hypothetical protein
MLRTVCVGASKNFNVWTHLSYNVSGEVVTTESRVPCVPLFAEEDENNTANKMELALMLVCESRRSRCVRLVF